MGEHTNTDPNLTTYREVGSHRRAGLSSPPMSRAFRLLVAFLLATLVASVGAIVGAGWAAAAEAGQTIDRVGTVLVQLDPGDTP